MPYCRNCGQSIDENASICPNCNAQTNPTPVKKENTLVETVKKLNLKNIGILLGGLIVLVLIVVLIASIFGGGYKKAVNNYIDATFFAKEKAVKSLIPDYLWDELEEEYDVEPDDVINIYEDDAELNMDEAKKLYGRNIKISYKIDDTDDVDEDELDRIKDELKEYGIKKKDVKKAIEADIEFYIKGKEDEDREEHEFILVKIKGKWYVYDSISNVVWYAMWS